MKNSRLLLSAVSCWLLLSGSPQAALAETTLPTVVFQRPMRTPDSGVPGDRKYGGSRGECINSQTQLQALVPAVELPTDAQTGLPKPTAVWGQSASASPTLWFSLSQPMPGAAVRVDIETDAGSRIGTYETTLSNSAGIFSAALPEGTLAEVGGLYQWRAYVTPDCPAGAAETMLVVGWIHRVAEPQSLAVSSEGSAETAAETTLESAVAYASEGMWFDTLTILMRMHHQNPNDETVKAALTELLSGEGLSPVSLALIAE